MEEEKDKWHWQEPNSAWRGVGIYHITLVVTSRESLLGTLVIPADDPAQAFVERTKFGNNLVEELLHVPTFYPEVKIVQFCLMPDHLHAIIYVTRQMQKSIRMVVRSFWQGAKKLGRAYTSSLQAELNSVVTDGETDNCSTHTTATYPYPIFTEMPFIRPLSRRGQLQAMIRYVQMNPQRLATKRLKPKFFRVQHNVDISGRAYDAVGNIAILMESWREPVHVRRAMVDAARCGDDKNLRDYMNSRVIAARNGAVMVSPFISPSEKEILMVLLKENRPVIYIINTGFGDYFKPSDALFDAVAAGHLLILSPMSSRDSKKRITREECVMLNNLAEEMAGTNHLVG